MPKIKNPSPLPKKSENQEEKSKNPESAQKEHGGPQGLEPTRYGDWEKNGRCVDF